MHSVKIRALALLLLLPSPPAPAPAGEVILNPANGELTQETSFTVSFPDSMIAPDLLGAGDAKWPVKIEPKIEAAFRWQSTTEGELTLKGHVAPGTHYRVTTLAGLKDASGQPLPKGNWEFDSPAFDITLNDEEKREKLSTQPRFELEANYPISMSDAAEHIFFQDRDSHERHPVEVLLSADQSAEHESSLTVLPRQPLPVGHAYDLVLDGLCDAYAHKPLAFLHVFAAGATEPLGLQWVGAFNPALSPPSIRVKFSEKIDPASVTPEALRITPAVTGLKLHADEDELVAEGAFDPKQRYQVHVGAALRGIRGFGLAKEERWGATFHPKDATIVFPGGEIFQRSARGLQFSFLQVNTGPTAWKLSSVPLAQLPEVAERVKQYQRGEPPFAFPVAGEGRFEANGGQEEVLRQIDWHPPAPLAGPYLLEVTGPDAEGHTVGNRALISFSEYVITQKRSADKAYVRVARMSDGQGAAGLRVHAVSSENLELGSATTDATGLATFPGLPLSPGSARGAHLFIVDTPAGPTLQYADAPTLGSADSPEKKPPLRALLVTDRNLYRPGQTVKLHGIMRLAAEGRLELPGVGPASWQIKASDAGAPLASGEAPLSAHGSWDAEWNIPSTLPTGQYVIAAGLGQQRVNLGEIRVEEYRVPLFSVELTPLEKPGAASLVNVSSSYFHGAPNAGARVHWAAVWSENFGAGDDTFVRNDAYSEHHSGEPEEQEATGDTVLDAQGHVQLRGEPPFKDGRPRGRCHVSWRVEVTSAEAQTFTGGAEATVQSEPAWAGLRAETHPGPQPTVAVEVNAIDLTDEPVAGTAVHVELFHVRSHTVKEKVAPFIARYRNSREYEKVGAKEAVTPATLDFPVKETGEYVAVLTSPGGALASTDLTLSGDDFAELAVENETEIGVSLPTPARAYRPGEIAPISVRAPFGGVAWVSIETGDLLETRLVPLAGNAGRVDLPVKKEYAPNATVSIYLLQPGGEKNLPRERLGQVQLQVERPDRTLVVEPKLAGASVKPGATVKGDVLVQSDGAPVAGAEFLVFAVDEAVLRLGEWKLPDGLKAFFPENPHTVSTLAALTRFVEQIKRQSLEQKGYVVGGGGEPLGNVALRKEFKTLAFWQPGLVTDASGKIHFEFPAPDNLTEYRLVAIGQTDANQFGGGSATFQVSKPLLCEPALPRFVRVGDELRLRAVVRQSGAPGGKVTVRCQTEGLELLDPAPVTQEAAKDQPTVFNFRARVPDGSSGAKVRFEATGDFGESDAVEVSLPIRPPSVLRHETFATRFTAPAFTPAASAPPTWLKGRGAFNVTLSTSPWLPELNGLPTILDYPHGCFEQISTQVLAYALMADLLTGLPDAEAREAHYRETLQLSLRRYEESLGFDGLLPYWPGSEGPGSPCVTVLAAWAVHEAAHAGLEVPATLRARLDQTLEKIIAGQIANVPLFTRSLALMVAAQPGAAKAYGDAAEDLYLKRDRAGDEERALLALALHSLGILPREKAQLIKEIAKPQAERAFDPDTFSSTDRASALVTLALARVTPGNPLLKERRAKMLERMDSSAGLSTQENLWLLLAFKALVESRPPPPLPVAAIAPAPTLQAKNQTALAWTSQDLARLAAFQVTGLPAETPLTALTSAEYRVDQPETTRTDRGLRVERVVFNLTDATRQGTPEAPFKLGDQILIRYRLISRNLHYYVALEDLLPAGLETVNPNLPQIAKNYHFPAETEGRLLALSHSELRDQSTCLYFNRLDPGVGTYAVLARATSAGTFRWPAVQAYPMYDSRFTGLSTASVCVVKE